MLYLCDGAYVGVLTVDLTKAFDSIPHRLLLQDMIVIGCSKTSLNWFSSYVGSRSQRVCQGTVVTPWKHITKGVPQGNVMRPRTYLKFAPDAWNSLPTHVKSAPSLDAFT